MQASQIVILGARGQLGLALQAQYPEAQTVDSETLDITNQQAFDAFDWSGVRYLINAAGYTNVDGAETPDGRIAAWQVNAVALANIARCAQRHDMTVVHISSDYVFDGTQKEHQETEPFSPLGVYGQSKAAGDIALSTLQKHYILRTSWVIGEGKNFVRTMLSVGSKNIDPTVVADQVGRLTFTSELVRAIDHLLRHELPFGTYNVTNDGESASWADITRAIFELAQYDAKVTNTTTEAYFIDKPGAAPRPLNSTLTLNKLQATGFTSTDWHDDLAKYVAKEKESL